MSTEGPTRAGRARTRRGRTFVLTFVVVVGVLAVLALGGAAATVAQGPRISSVQVDAAASAAASGSRLIITTSQALAKVDVSQVSVTPAADFTVDTAGRSVGVRFALPLRDDTEYTVSFTDVQGVGGGPAGSFSYTFSTPPIDVYILQRTASGDTIFRTGLPGDEAVPVFRNDHIEDFRATSGHLVVSVVENDLARLLVTDLDGGSERELPLPGDGLVTSLQNSDRGEMIGYTFSDANLGAGGKLESALFTASLKESDAATRPAQVTVTGAEARVGEWRFVPDSDSILLITFDGSLLLTDPSGKSTTSLGSALSISGMAPGQNGTSEALVRRIDGVVVINLADASEQPLVSPDTDIGMMVSSTPVPGGGTVRRGATVNSTGPVTQTTIAFVGDDGASRVLLAVPPTDAVLQTCVSPSGRYAAVLVGPNGAANPYDGYQMPLPGKVETHIVDILTGSEVSTLAGFDISWCRLSLR